MAPLGRREERALSPRPVDVEHAPDARGEDDRQPAEMVAEVLQTAPSVLGGALRLVAGRRRAVAVEPPRPDEAAVVRRVAVRADPDLVAVVGDRDGILERRQVAD